jgi:hypothetical protein
MSALTTVTERQVWTCPMCGHGSPEPRDEAAHLDAHRHQGQFFEDWEGAVRSDRARERRGTAVIVLAGLVALVLVVVGAVSLLRLGRDESVSGPPAGAGAPAASAPVAPPEGAAPPTSPTGPSTPPPPAAAPQPAPATPATGTGGVAPTTPAAVAPPAAGSSSSSSPSSSAAAGRAGASASVPAPEPPYQPHVLDVWLLNIHLVIL